MELSAWLLVLTALVAVVVAATAMRDLGRYLRIGGM
jgi:hypothetical protein